MLNDVHSPKHNAFVINYCVNINKRGAFEVEIGVLQKKFIQLSETKCLSNEMHIDM